MRDKDQRLALYLGWAFMMVLFTVTTDFLRQNPSIPWFVDGVVVLVILGVMFYLIYRMFKIFGRG